MNLGTRRRTWKIVATAAVATLASAALSVITAPAANADGTVVAGNQKCSELIPGSLELKVEPVDSGTYTGGPLTVKLTVYHLPTDVSDHPGDQTGNQVFDFTASGAAVIGVGVKGGPNTNLYAYPAAATSGTRLHTPVNTKNDKFPGLSHVSFCYQPKAKPKIATKVSHPEITIGGSVSDTATLAAGNQPTGTITFKVYGPDDATCTGPATTVGSVAVNGNGGYPSPAFKPNAVGTYRWIASYSGDARNEPVSGACGDANEQVVVKKAKPKLGTVPNLLPNDTATISGLVAPSGGTVSFKLFTNLTCTGTPVYAETQPVDANASFVTKNTTVRVSADSSISWIVGYSGDARNEAAVSACTDEQVVMDFTPLR